MPKRSTASLTIASISPGPRRLEPPPELGAGSIEREIFSQTVASVPAGHFGAEDLPILSAYARAAALERRAAEELQVSAVVGGQPSPWLAVCTSATLSMLRLSVKLRIGPRSRAPNNARKVKGGMPQPSYYDTMETERGR
jgi:hypothetical protein